MFGNQAFSNKIAREELIAANQLFCVLLFGEVSYIRKWSIL